MRLLLIATAALAGCVSARPADTSPVDGAAIDGAAIDGAAVARSVVLCTSTEADLRARLGAPTRDGRLHGERVLSWITGEDGVVHFLAVLLDARGTVVDLYWDLPSEIPWVPASQCL